MAAGVMRATISATTSADAASSQKGPRHPASRPATLPRGTPATTARLSPPDMTASDRAPASGGAIAAATTAPTAQNVPVANAVTTRATVTNAKESVGAATT